MMLENGAGDEPTKEQFSESFNWLMDIARSYCTEVMWTECIEISEDTNCSKSHKVIRGMRMFNGPKKEDAFAAFVPVIAEKDKILAEQKIIHLMIRK